MFRYQALPCPQMPCLLLCPNVQVPVANMGVLNNEAQIIHWHDLHFEVSGRVCMIKDIRIFILWAASFI
jgi:hypothetical protein